MNAAGYIKIGKIVFDILKVKHPEIGKIPVAEIIAVVEVITTSTKSVDNTRIVKPQGLMSSADAAGSLVIE